MTPRQLRRAALIGVLVGIALVVVSGIAPGMPEVSTNSNVWISFLWSAGLLLGCGAVVLAANALAWSFIVPTLPTGQHQRTSAITGWAALLAILSIVATFLLYFAVISNYQTWGAWIAWV